MVRANKCGEWRETKQIKNIKSGFLLNIWISSKYINEECLRHSKSDSIEFMIYNNADESLLLR